MKYFKHLLPQLYYDLSNSPRLFRRTLIAQWRPVDIKNNVSATLQVLTDAMTYGSTIQINYRNSGWRTILPYGWNSSKSGNILLMCYKDSGEIRSYRIDRIYDILINDTLLEQLPGDRPVEHATMKFEDFEIPMLPNLDEIVKKTEAEVNEELPYDAGLKALTENKIPEDFNKQQDINNIQQDGEDLTDKESDDNSADEDLENKLNDIDTDTDTDTDADLNLDDELDEDLDDENSDDENLDDNGSDNENLADNNDSNEEETSKKNSNDDTSEYSSANNFGFDNINFDILTENKSNKHNK